MTKHVTDPCPRCGCTLRYDSSGQCVDCAKRPQLGRPEAQRRYQEKNRNTVNAAKRAYRERHRERLNAAARAAYVPTPRKPRLPPEELAARKAKRKRKARLAERAAKAGRTVSDQRYWEWLRKRTGAKRPYVRKPATVITVVQAGAVTVLAF